jgi:hypothetical protein
MRKINFFIPFFSPFWASKKAIVYSFSSINITDSITYDHIPGFNAFSTRDHLHISQKTDQVCILTFQKTSIDFNIGLIPGVPTLSLTLDQYCKLPLPPLTWDNYSFLPDIF